MKTYLDCLPCLLGQALKAARAATDDEELHQVKELEIDFVVRERPIINDATLDDAIATGMDKVARIVPSGSDASATILSQCSSEMLKLYYSADIIIAKGQGNYESLKGEPGNIFFLLRAKCPVVAELLGVNVGDAVLKQHPVPVGNEDKFKLTRRAYGSGNY